MTSLLLSALLLTMQDPTGWEGIDARKTPAWVYEARLGILIHWGVYSVPAWAPKGQYAEWYQLQLGKIDSPTRTFHLETYGGDVTYKDFAPRFRAERFDPDRWAELFLRSGAGFVVLTAKHHDGYCLWPSELEPGWNVGDVGPHRDLVADLSRAVREKQLRMGLYCSLNDWSDPLCKGETLERYRREHLLPQLRDLVTRYHPSLLWADGDYDRSADAWGSLEFLSWLFKASPVTSEIAVNDRWGRETRQKHGSFWTSRPSGGSDRPWMETLSIGASYGFSRREKADECLTSSEVVHHLIEAVSRGGILLLNVGPMADGTIPMLQQERLVDLGDWLRVNREAIFGARPWRSTRDGASIRYTTAEDAVYAIALSWPDQELVLTEPRPKGASVTATLLGSKVPLKVRTETGRMVVEIPPLAPYEIPCRHAYIFKLSGVQ